MSTSTNKKDWTTKAGDVQAGIGHLSGTMNYIGAIIGGSIFILLGITLIILAFIPLGGGHGFSCQEDHDCLDSEETCDPKKGKCIKKKKRYWWLSLIGLLLIGLAIGGIFYAKWYHKWVHENRTNAQIGGTIAEAQFLSNLLRR